MKVLVATILVYLAVVFNCMGHELNLPVKGQIPVTRVDFIAVEESDAQVRLSPNLVLNIGGGIGFPGMDGLNDYTGWINDSFSGGIEDIDSYWQFNSSLEYFFRRDLSLGIGYEFLTADTDGTLYFLGTPHHFEVELEVDGLELFVTKSWPFKSIPSIQLATSAGIGYYWSTYREAEDGYRVSGDDESWGVKLAGDVRWTIARHVSLAFEAGYRWLDFDDYGVQWVSPGHPEVETDFSGPVIEGKLIWVF